MRRCGYGIALLALEFLCVRTSGAQPFQAPQLREYVTDFTFTLSPEQREGLNRRLLKFDQETSTQIVAVIVQTTGDLTIEEAALKVAEVNKIGRGGRDNGLLLFVAKEDRQVRIEVGYGLEGALPDILAGQIVRNEILPRFRSGDYAGGISAGVEAIMLATKNEYAAEPVTKTTRKQNLFPYILLFLVIVAFLRRRKGGRGIPPFLGGGGGFGGGGFSGGGFSGGGGSFGGGGASGRW